MKKRLLSVLLALVLLLGLTASPAALLAPQAEAATATGEQIVNKAKEYLGKVPYVYGGKTIDGSSPGADCSGFICRIYEKFGFNLWAHRTKLRNAGTNLGTDLSVARLGDIIWFDGHVAIYAGKKDGAHMIVHETGGSYQNVVYTKVSVVRAELKGIIRIPGVINDDTTTKYYGKVHDTDGSLSINQQAKSTANGATRLGTIPEGGTCIVYTDKGSGGWYWVEYNGVQGYAYSKYITLGDPVPIGHTHNGNYNKGYCDACGTWLPNQNNNASVATGLYQFTADSQYNQLMDHPYQIAETYGTCYKVYNGGDVVTVTGAVVNGGGNTWYKISDGSLTGYAFSGRLTPYTHTHTDNYQKGYCDDCGTWVPNQNNSVSVTTGLYEFTADSQYNQLMDHPYQIAETYGACYKVYSGGDVVTVTGAVTNGFGNLWYKVSDGNLSGYAFSDRLTPHTHRYVNGTCAGCGASDPDYTPPAKGSEVHFPRQAVYRQGQFRDVFSSDWFAGSVSEAYSLGLMKGKSSNTFAPRGSVTMAEAITMAARIHSIYTTGKESFPAASGSAWYQPYVDYAYDNGILAAGDYFTDANAAIERASFAYIFSRALPAEALPAVNRVADGAIPDVDTDEDFVDNIYQLYRAGILAVSDSQGTFHPYTAISRAECAAIVSRMAESDNRVSFTLD